MQALWRNGLWIAAGMLLVGGLAALRATYATPFYRTEALVAVRSPDTGGAAGVLGGQLGGLASLAGIELGGGGSREAEYVAILSSRSLARALIERDGLLPVLFHKQWDPAAKRWKGKPRSVGDAVDLFVKKLRAVSQDRKTGLVTVAVEWSDPKLAARWATSLVDMANRQIRREAIAEAQRNLTFLRGEERRLQVESVRLASYRLVEANMNQIMLANIQPDYAFKTIERAEVPEIEKPVRPKLVLETLIGAVLGGLLAALVVAWRARASIVSNGNATRQS